MKWLYGNAWERFPIEPGEVWGLENGSRIAVHNIFEPLPKFMRSDLLFVDPPWNLSNVNSFYTKAERTDHLKDFRVFADVLFRRIKEIEPHTAYIEIGNQNVDDWEKRLGRLYPCVQRWHVTYYRQHPTWIIRGSENAALYDFTDIDEAKCIEIIAKIETYSVMGDLCMGRGLVGLAAYKAGKPFVGTELNKRRLACLLEKLSALGADVKKLRLNNEIQNSKIHHSRNRKPRPR